MVKTSYNPEKHSCSSKVDMQLLQLVHATGRLSRYPLPASTAPHRPRRSFGRSPRDFLSEAIGKTWAFCIGWENLHRKAWSLPNQWGFRVEICPIQSSEPGRFNQEEWENCRYEASKIGILTICHKRNPKMDRPCLDPFCC